MKYAAVVVAIVFGCSGVVYGQEPPTQEDQLKAVRETLLRLERRLIALEQKPTPGEKPKDPVLAAIENGRKQIEKACKDAGGRWMWALPVASTPEQREEIQGTYFVGCVGK